MTAKRKIRNGANARIRKKYAPTSPEQFKQRVIYVAQRAAKGKVRFDELFDLEIIAAKCKLSDCDMKEFRNIINRIKANGNIQYSKIKSGSSTSVHTVPNRIG